MSIVEKVATLMAKQPTYEQQRIATLEQQNAELVAALEKAAAHVRPTCSDLYDELETALSKVKQP